MLEIIGRRLALDTGWIWLLDPESGRFYLAASLNSLVWLLPYQEVQKAGIRFTE